MNIKLTSKFQPAELALLEACKNTASNKTSQKKEMSLRLTQCKEEFVTAVTSITDIKSVLITSPFKSFTIQKLGEYWELNIKVAHSIVIERFESLKAALTHISDKGFPAGYELVDIECYGGEKHQINLSELTN